MAPILTFDGAIGTGRSTMLRDLSSAWARTGRPLYFLRCPSPTEDQELVTSAIVTGAGALQLRHRVSLDDTLALVGDHDQDEQALIVVDDADFLSPKQAEDIGAFAADRRTRGTATCFSVNSALDHHEVTATLTRLSLTAEFSLSALADDAIWAMVAGSRDDVLGRFRQPSLELCRGNPGMAVALRQRLSTLGAEGQPPDMATFTRACIAAVRGFALGQLTRHDRHGLDVAVLVGLLQPEGDTAQACELLDVRLGRTAYYRELLDQLGLIRPSCPWSSNVVRRALLDNFEGDVEQLATSALRFFDRRRAPAIRYFDVLDLLGQRNDRFVEAARAAAESALVAKDVATLSRIADSVLTNVSDPGRTTWARTMVTDHFLQHDWHKAAGGLDQGWHLPARLRERSHPVPLQFFLEAPHAAQLLAASAPGPASPGTPPSAADIRDHAFSTQALLLSGARIGAQPLASCLGLNSERARPWWSSLEAEEELATQTSCRATAVAVLAMSGAGAERHLCALESWIRSTDNFSRIGGHTATMMALAHLALADPNAALRWSRFAIALSGHDRAPQALAYLLAAQAEIHRNEFSQAAELAEQAEELFSEVNAGWLVRVARATATHAAIEQRAPIARVRPDHDGQGGDDQASKDQHPAHRYLQAYLTYVDARHQLIKGDAQSALSNLFRTGRLLGSGGLLNPTLLNWRQHIAAIFQADRELEFSGSITGDLSQSMLRWRRRNPQAGARHAERLLRHLGGGAQSGHTPSPLAAAETTALSSAEERVVELILQGRSSAEVSRTLFLSKRTVDTHLGHVYRKLGVHSRQELAVALTGCVVSDSTLPSSQKNLVN